MAGFSRRPILIDRYDRSGSRTAHSKIIRQVGHATGPVRRRERRTQVEGVSSGNYITADLRRDAIQSGENERIRRSVLDQSGGAFGHVDRIMLARERDRLNPASRDDEVVVATRPYTVIAAATLNSISVTTRTERVDAAVQPNNVPAPLDGK